MNTNNRRSAILKRRTLLCYSTLCLFLLLILILCSIQVFHNHSVNFHNKTVSLNVIKFRSLLIECGQSVVKREHFYRSIQQFTDLIKTNSNTCLNDQLDENILKQDLIIWLEYILKECYQARQFLIVEQQNPMIIRRIISTIRKEILYIAAFFIKDI
ncbi:hypothetical protein I4U23_006133 [Adineta vaga]|nr:hypothetical protein I4U23_006133 [Adineta vaga]